MPGPEGTPSGQAEEAKIPAYLVFDTESVPDGKLIGLVKYPGENLTERETVERAQAEARSQSTTGSDFLPVTFQYPVAVCILCVDAEFRLQSIKMLDAPEFRPAEIVRQFWRGLSRYPRARPVTFNGRGFDLPLLELAAFRYGLSASSYFRNSRDRYKGNHLDLLEMLSNFGASRMTGGLNLLSKILGKPGKMNITGDQVYAMFLEGKKQEINDYCLFDTLDTYFVFLRTRVVTGELTLENEQNLVRQEAKAWLAGKTAEYPALQHYLDNWGDWTPWP